MHGTAFEIRESTQDAPNRTMATVEMLKQDGVKVAKWGYFSDILLGPFIPFGIDSEYKSMLKTANEQHIHVTNILININ